MPFGHNRSVAIHLKKQLRKFRGENVRDAEHIPSAISDVDGQVRDDVPWLLSWVHSECNVAQLDGWT